jgi:uncharacterized protein (TIRG00374 family)
MGRVGAVASEAADKESTLLKAGLRSWLGYAAKSIVAGGILFALFRWDIIRVSDIQRALEQPASLIQVGLCILAMILVTAWRWRQLLRSQGVAVPFPVLFRIYFLSLACAPLFPGGIGGDAMRVAYTVRAVTDRKVVAAVSVLVDRVIAMVGVLIVAFVLLLPYIPAALSGSFALLALIAVVSGLFAGCLVFITLALLSRRRTGFTQWLHDRFQNRLISIVAAVFDAVSAYRSHPKVVIGAIMLSAANQAFVVYAIYVIARQLGFDLLAMSDIGIAATLTQIANILPLTPGGIGIGEAAFDRILSLLTSSGVAVGYGSIFLTFRVLGIVVTLPGVLGLLWKSS